MPAIDDLEKEEAARILGVSAMTVKRRLTRGLRLLTERLSDMQPEDWN